jgi:selenocysteine lyase/cysteine desulfurase
VKAKALQDALWARHVRVRAQNDARGVRLSAHIYMSPSDVDTVLDVASNLANTTRGDASRTSHRR